MISLEANVLTNKFDELLGKAVHKAPFGETTILLDARYNLETYTYSAFMTAHRKLQMGLLISERGIS